MILKHYNFSPRHENVQCTHLLVYHGLSIHYWIRVDWPIEQVSEAGKKKQFASSFQGRGMSGKRRLLLFGVLVQLVYAATRIIEKMPRCHGCRKLCYHITRRPYEIFLGCKLPTKLSELVPIKDTSVFLAILMIRPCSDTLGLSAEKSG